MNGTWERLRIHSHRRYWLVFASIALAASAAVGLLIQGQVVADTQDHAADLAIASAADTGKAFAAVTKRVAPAVVFIKATRQRGLTGNTQGFGNLEGQIPDELLRRFFGGQLPNRQRPREWQRSVGQGSGFIISKDGYILTNNHVVGEADTLEVTLHDGRRLPAKLVGTDDRTDVAIVKIDAGDLPVLAMGDSDKMEVGEWVLAVGSPFGLAGTVTSGIVSAKGRDGMGITDYEDFLQTDAAINPGNSGGPLVNLQGEAIGINTAIISRSGGYNGIGFAIPMSMARQICEQLIENGSVTRGYLGVMIQPLTPELAKSFAIDESHGILVGDVTDDGPAADAGLQRGDVIVGMNGDPVEDMASFRNRVAMIKPDTSVDLEVLRGGGRKTTSVKVGTLPNKATASSGVAGTVETLGLSVQTLDEQLAGKLGLDTTTGVVVTRVVPGSDAAGKGIRPGTVIREVDRRRIENVGQFEEAVKAGKDTGSVLLLLQSGEHTRYVVLKLEK